MGAVMSNIENALSYLSPNVPRDEWVTILMAIKSELGDSGYTLAEQWSKSGESYCPSDFKATWKSIKATGGINIGTLFKQAKEKGFTPNPLEPLPRLKAISEKEHLEQRRQAEIAEQQAIEARIQSVANYWKTLKAKHPPQPCLSHPYLERKGIQPHGVHYLPCYSDKHTQQHGNDPLVLWVMRGKQLTGFQMIYPDGFKAFIAGTVKQGGYYLVTKDKDPQTADRIVLCEVFATCCSVIEHRYPNAMGYIAFDAGNLPSVAVYLRELYPDKDIYICADNDHVTEKSTGKNPGVIYGKQATRMANAHIEYPEFAGNNAESYSDWNDYYTVKLAQEGKL